MRPVVDHVPFAVDDLESGIDLFESAGLPMQRGGSHAEVGTENALVPFPDGSYLEAIASTHDQPDLWEEYFQGAQPLAGPCGWIVETGSVHSECQRLIEHGVEVHGPTSGRRERPDGTTAEWDMAFLGSDEDNLLPVLLADRTPRGRRVPESSLYGSPLSGIDRVVLGVNDLAATVELFRGLYRLPSPEEEFDQTFGEMAWFPGQDIVFAEPVDGAMRDRVDTYGPSPLSVLLVADVDEASHQFQLAERRDWLGRRVRFFSGFDLRIGVISRD